MLNLLNLPNNNSIAFKSSKLNAKNCFSHKINPSSLIKDRVCFSSNSNDVDLKDLLSQGIVLDFSTPGSSSDSKKLSFEKIDTISNNFSAQLLIACSSGTISKSDIELLMLTYAPELAIKIKNINELPNIDPNTEALYYPDYDNNGNLKTGYLFINFSKPTNKIVKSITHEFTHALQFSTSRAQELMKRIYDNETPSDKYFKAYTEFETQILDINLYKTIDKNNEIISKMLLMAKNKARELLNAINFSTKQRVEQYDSILDVVLKNYDIKDKQLALEYFKFRLDCETQAYKQGSIALKRSLNKANKTLSYDLIPKMYEDLSNYIAQKLTKNI
ncbi:MAG: hypothetical protein AB1782_11315 [Cyanobacteriota bacterium]